MNVSTTATWFFIIAYFNRQNFHLHTNQLKNINKSAQET